MKEKKETDLGKDKLGMLLLKLALPAILAQIINVLYNMVDRMYIGHIPKAGPDALTGVGVTMPVIMAISAFAALVSMGGAPRASIMMGRKDHKQAEKILGNCTMMLIIMAVILTGVFLIWGENILLIFGASEKTIGYALDYMKIYAMGTIFVQLALGLNAFINAQGFAKMGMLTVAIGAIINIILDFLFVKYLKWGVAGAGYATLIAQAISAIMIIYVLMKSEEAHQLIIKDIRFDVPILKKIIMVGLPTGLQQSIVSLSNLVVQSYVNGFGSSVVAGYSASIRIDGFVNLPLQSFNMAITTFVGQNIGAKQFDRVKKGTKIAMAMTFAVIAFISVILFLYGKSFIAVFNSEPSVVEAGRTMQLAFVPFYIVLPIVQIYNGVLRGAGKSSVPMYIMVFNFVILRQIYLILITKITSSVYYVFMGWPVTWVTCAIMFIIYYHKVNWLNENNAF